MRIGDANTSKGEGGARRRASKSLELLAGDGGACSIYAKPSDDAADAHGGEGGVGRATTAGRCVERARSDFPSTGAGGGWGS